MTTLRFISGQAALAEFIQGIHKDVDKRLDDRGINASGRLKRSNRTEVVPGVGSTSAHFSALGYWKQAGSGSPPGTDASLSGLFQWAKDKGLANNDRRAARIALLTRRKIKEEGSKQWREHGENVYENAVAAAQPKIPALLTVFLKDVREPVVSQFKRAFA